MRPVWQNKAKAETLGGVHPGLAEQSQRPGPEEACAPVWQNKAKAET